MTEDTVSRCEHGAIREPCVPCDSWNHADYDRLRAIEEAARALVNSSGWDTFTAESDIAALNLRAALEGPPGQTGSSESGESVPATGGHPSGPERYAPDFDGRMLLDDDLDAMAPGNFA